MAHQAVIDLGGKRRFMSPDRIFTPDDWIAMCRPRDPKRRPFRIGVDHWLTEAQAYRRIEQVINWRRVGPCDVRMKRRRQWPGRTEPTAPELLLRYDKNAND